MRVADPETGLRSLIAVHDTTLGPALGGARFHPYADDEAALYDVLRLARGMTYKSAVAGIDVGGGKAVIIGDPRRDKTPELLRAYGRFVDRLGGRYVTAPDVGTSEADMVVVREATGHVTGLPLAHGGFGDPSPATARGLWHALRGVQRWLTGGTDLSAWHVVVLGTGKVGSALVRLLQAEGSRITVADVDRGRAEALGVAVVDPETAHTVECDVFSPCALGGILDPRHIAGLRCRAVVGAANNQLSTPESAGLLAARGIVYAPDYVVNAGGIISVAEELRHGSLERVAQGVVRIEATTVEVLERAAADGITTAVAADAMAEARLARARAA